MKVKSFIAALLLTVAGLQTASAQGFRVYKSDGTVAQFSLRTDSIVFYEGIGSDVDFGPFTPVNQSVVGTWYKSKTESVTFNEDGTTDYMEGATYEFFPYQGNIVIYNESGAPVNYFKVLKVTEDKLVVGTCDSSSIMVWSTTQPSLLVEEIVLNEVSITLNVDETKTLTATVLSEDADNKDLTWSSSNTDVATIDEMGNVTAIAAGSCTITCCATDDSGVKAECQVTVIQLVTDITLSETSLSLSIGSSHTLAATIEPSTTSNPNITWSSNNTYVATVDQTGNVIGNAQGSCIITCYATDGSGVKAECQVTVIQLVTGITLSETNLFLQPEDKRYVTATILPGNADNKEVVWESSDENVATVTDGLIVAVTNGTCVVTCNSTDGSGVKAECQVQVMADTHEYVDLGLPSGTLWATCNVGAERPEQYGVFFPWGETEESNICSDWQYSSDWNNYKYCDGSENTLTKYCLGSIYGTIDNKSELEPIDDAATVNWGGNWQMPSYDQFEELINGEYTRTEFIRQNAVYGVKITSKSNGNSIFLPIIAGAGHYYWSRTLFPGRSSCAMCLYIRWEISVINTQDMRRANNWSVRPVRKQ